jgi:hypothetical protein
MSWSRPTSGPRPHKRTAQQHGVSGGEDVFQVIRPEAVFLAQKVVGEFAWPLAHTGQILSYSVGKTRDQDT